MKLAKQPSIEMAPDHYWDVYQTTEATIALPGDSCLLDDALQLEEILTREEPPRRPLEDHWNPFATVLDQGEEAKVYTMEDYADSLVMKVDRHRHIGKERSGLRPRVVRMAQFGGVCLEQVIEGLEVNGASFVTPHYEAVVTRHKGLSGVIMTKLPMVQLQSYIWDGDITFNDANDFVDETGTHVAATLIKSGLDSSILDHIDVSPKNILVGKTPDGSMDWSNVALVDALHILSCSKTKIEPLPKRRASV